MHPSFSQNLQSLLNPLFKTCPKTYPFSHHHLSRSFTPQPVRQHLETARVKGAGERRARARHFASPSARRRKFFNPLSLSLFAAARQFFILSSLFLARRIVCSAFLQRVGTSTLLRPRRKNAALERELFSRAFCFRFAGVGGTRGVNGYI